MFALYEGSLAEPGDRNPYAGRSLVLAKLWLRGYTRMLRVRIQTGPAMSRYRNTRAVAETMSDQTDTFSRKSVAPDRHTTRPTAMTQRPP